MSRSEALCWKVAVALPSAPTLCPIPRVTPPVLDTKSTVKDPLSFIIWNSSVGTEVPIPTRPFDPLTNNLFPPDPT